MNSLPSNTIRRSNSLRSDEGPKLAKLRSPRIVETEIWKKEIYKKVVEEVKEYNESTKGQRNYRSGSLPNLSEDKYTSSVEIQLVPCKEAWGEKKRKQSDHEKEILQLCDDIIAEMKVNKPETVIPLTVDSGSRHIYDKIDKDSLRSITNSSPVYHKIDTSSYRTVQDEPIYDKINKRSNICEGKKVETVVKDTSKEMVDTFITKKEVKIVTVPLTITEKEACPRNQENIGLRKSTEALSKETSKQYFENLVSMLEEAVKDISR